MKDVTVPIGMKVHGISGKEYRAGAVVPGADLAKEQAVKLSKKFDKQVKGDEKVKAD